MTRHTVDRRADSATPSDLLVNGLRLRTRDVAAEVANFPAASPAASWEAARRALVLRLLLHQRAATLGLVPDPQIDTDGRVETEEDAVLRTLLEAELPPVTVADAAVAAYYAANPERFRAPDLFQASHILFAAAPADAAARAAARQKAAAASAALDDAPARFAELAAALSDCSSRAQGGALGQIGEGETAPEFESALRGLARGEISAPVETRFGVHLIRLEDRADGAVLPFATVRGRIGDYLAARARHRATADYLAALLAAATVEPVPAEAESTAAHKLRSFADTADDGSWTQLVGKMNQADDPGRAAIETIVGTAA